MSGAMLTYALPDEVLRGVEAVSRHTSGQIGAPNLVTDENTKDRYIVRSLIEEAITWKAHPRRIGSRRTCCEPAGRRATTTNE
ncbi:hypothetical protein Acor_18490 [Acrocarpospora corrugata]|uniref:Uncharacterized protein n=1 Tax=Acrocarpospora corrugata TaxID=35763 RepID=A0A5M3VT28_9ACTN|nr:hypothetical protein [Acrocarpospora corrugata]GER99785.1 hypothetical protein Acor_18490 [Acrocarpospora corrugata]